MMNRSEFTQVQGKWLHDIAYEQDGFIVQHSMHTETKDHQLTLYKGDAQVFSANYDWHEWLVEGGRGTLIIENAIAIALAGET